MGYVAPAPAPGPDGYRQLFSGMPAPWFEQASTHNPRFQFDLAAGRYIVLCFFASAADAPGRRALSFLSSHRALFDDEKISFFGVSIHWQDERDPRVRESLPGARFFWDFNLKVSRLYGAVPVDATPGLLRVRRFWCVLDPTLRILAVVPFGRDGSEHRTLLELLERLPAVERFAGIDSVPPVLYLLNAFDEGLCRRLIADFEVHGGRETGSMVQIDGKTIAVHDSRHKRRADHVVTDPALLAEVQALVRRRVAPEIAKVFQFDATQTERHLVACYRAKDGGHFAAHRDNTTTATAHRRFAASINLNADYEGGEIVFPEYGSRRFRPPVGGAVVFSCSLLHAVSPVTSGRRYAFLPFVHDEAAERVMRENHPAFVPEVGTPAATAPVDAAIAGALPARTRRLVSTRNDAQGNDDWHE